MYKAIAEIVNVLIQAHKEGKSVNLSRIKQDICARSHIPSQPKTVDIINAIPEQYKKALMPSLKAKPIRTASGVCFILYIFLMLYHFYLIYVFFFFFNFIIFFFINLDCCCCCYV